MKKPQAPCLFCTQKHLGCHSECEKYKDYKSEHARWSDIVKEEKIKEHEMTRMEIKRFQK